VSTRKSGEFKAPEVKTSDLLKSRDLPSGDIRTADLTTSDLIADGARFSGGAGPKVSEKASEAARAFLSGLFMAQRTAQFHDIHNKAYSNAVQTVHQAAATLYASTNGFTISFVGDTTFLNNGRLRIDGIAFAAIRSLRKELELRQIGGLVMKSPPTYENTRSLVVMLTKTGPVSPDDLAAAGVGTLGIQTFVDDGKQVKIDRRILAVQSYAKLMLAIREQFERQAQGTERGPQKLRAVRVIQDLIELGEDRADLVLRLASNRSGHWPAETYGADCCLLAIVLGQALGLDRANLVDLALGAMFHHLGVAGGHASTKPLDNQARQSSMAKVLKESGVGRSTSQRAVAIAEHRRLVEGRQLARKPHLHARILGVVSTYVQLVTGYGLKKPVRSNPVDALGVLLADRSGRFDPDVVDLLINVLRAFPVGTDVALESGERGIVATHAGSRRWDRPVLKMTSGKKRNLDLMIKSGDRFPERIIGTARFLGLDDSAPASKKTVSATQPHASLAGEESQLAIPGAPKSQRRGTGDLPRLTQMDADGGGVKRHDSAEDLFKDFLDDA
jgi:hypothetical protein